MDPQRQHEFAVATAAAERFNELADIAELMGDNDGAMRLRQRAAFTCERAMALLDEWTDAT